MIIAALLLGGCNYYPEYDGRRGVDQYGYQHTNTGRCLAPGFFCSVRTDPQQRAHNRALRAEEKRMERAMRKARE